MITTPILGPAMVLNVVMRWPRAVPMAAISGYTAAAFAGVAPVPEPIAQMIHVSQPQHHEIVLAQKAK